MPSFFGPVTDIVLAIVLIVGSATGAGHANDTVVIVAVAGLSLAACVVAWRVTR